MAKRRLRNGSRCDSIHFGFWELDPKHEDVGKSIGIGFEGELIGKLIFDIKSHGFLYFWPLNQSIDPWCSRPVWVSKSWLRWGQSSPSGHQHEVLTKKQPWSLMKNVEIYYRTRDSNQVSQVVVPTTHFLNKTWSVGGCNLPKVSLSDC